MPLTSAVVKILQILKEKELRAIKPIKNIWTLKLLSVGPDEGTRLGFVIQSLEEPLINDDGADRVIVVFAGRTCPMIHFLTLMLEVFFNTFIVR